MRGRSSTRSIGERLGELGSWLTEEHPIDSLFAKAKVSELVSSGKASCVTTPIKPINHDKKSMM